MKYDIVVIGGGTAGCAVAYISAKRGLKTLLVEKNTYLGGTITGALVTPAMKTSSNQINLEFFDEFINELKNLGGQATYSDNNKGWVNPELAKIALDRLLLSVGVDVYLSTHVTNIYTESKLIKSLTLSSAPKIITKDLSEYIEARLEEHASFPSIGLSVNIETGFVVDATGNQDICNALNCKKIDDNGQNQPCSLRFILGGVDLKMFSDFILDLDRDREATTATVINGEIHLSTACTWDKEWALSPLFERAVQEGVLKDSDRAYFQLFTIPGAPGMVAFNCPRCPNAFDLTDITAKSRELINARAAILRFLEFTKKYLPGFEKAFISSIAPELGIRVAPRALGKYLYTIDDLRSGKTFETPVLVSNYPIDVHSSDKSGAKLEKVYKEYQLPIESLISADYDNLFFAGRGISADFFAQAALRIIPSCFSMGEGLANYLASMLI